MICPLPPTHSFFRATSFFFVLPHSWRWKHHWSWPLCRRCISEPRSWIYVLLELQLQCYIHCFQNFFYFLYKVALSPDLSFCSSIFRSTCSVSFLALSVGSSLSYSSFMPELALRAKLISCSASCVSLPYLICCTEFKFSLYLFTLITCGTRLWYFAFWSGSTKGHPADRRSYSNI